MRAPKNINIRYNIFVHFPIENANLFVIPVSMHNSLRLYGLHQKPGRLYQQGHMSL